MKLLYLIQAHKDPDQLSELVRLLCDEDTAIIINIDNKTDITPFLPIREIAPERIQFVTKRRNVFWGDISQINATLEMIRVAVEGRLDFDYACFISGQDFPIVSNAGIKAFFKAAHGASFLDINPLPFSRWNFEGGIGRLKYYWFIRPFGIRFARVIYYLQKAVRISRRLPEQTLFGGSSWWSLAREAVHYIHREGFEGSPYYARYKRTLCTDEVYFQTLLLNSPLKETIINDNLRYIDWDTGPEWPKLLDESDFGRIAGSGKLYARKLNGAGNKLAPLLKQHHVQLS